MRSVLAAVIMVLASSLGLAGQTLTGLATGTPPDPAVTRLTPASDGRSLVARLGRQPMSARIVLTVAFEATRPAERFDNTFEQVSLSSAGRSRKAAPATRKPTAPLPQLLGAGQTAVPPPDPSDFQAAAERLPASTPELVALLRSRHQEVSDLLGRGQLGGIYLPALLAKDIALKLEEHRDELPVSSRARVSDAVRRVVMAAWRIDAFGDVSDQLSVTRAFEEFSVAIGVLTAAYAAP